MHSQLVLRMVEIVEEVGLVITPGGICARDTRDGEKFKGRDEDAMRPEETDRSVY